MLPRRGWHVGTGRQWQCVCRASKLLPCPDRLLPLCFLQAPPTPPVDPENEEFVIFVRSKKVGAGCTLVRSNNLLPSPRGFLVASTEI